MKSGKQAIEAIALRRATLVDPDKVRYRVYSTPTEFIAVIAESALMAVKVSGIAKPHRIVRDLPTAGASVTAQNISPPNHEAARVPLPTQMTEKKAIHVAPHEVAKKANPDEQFQPLDMRDLQKKVVRAGAHFIAANADGYYRAACAACSSSGRWRGGGTARYGRYT